MSAEVKALPSALATNHAENRGLFLGLIGVASFSLTLPMTRLAVAQFDATFVGLGRALVAAVIATGVLLFNRERFPARKHWVSLLVVGGGVVIGFPLFSALAMRNVPAAHGAVVIALLPLATAIVAVFRAHERPSAIFWVAALLGAGAVASFLVLSQGAKLQRSDLFLLAAVVTCAVGYAEGGRLARELGGWRVIAWALVFMAPVILVPVILSARHGLHGSITAWAGFFYLGVVSMFLGFCAWYAGLALGGVARVSQTQLLQPFLTLGASALILGEEISPRLVMVAVVVVATIVVARRAPVKRAALSR